MLEYKKICPKCGREQIYSSKSNLKRALEENSVCNHCQSKHARTFSKGNLGHTHSTEAKNKMKKAWEKRPHIFSDETRRKMSASAKGKIVSDETRNKMRLANLGKKLSGETKKKISKNSASKTPDVKRKLRLARIKQLERDIFNGNQVFPSYNPNACKIIDEYGKKHGYNFQHAMNGGEYFIEKLGYWVDGYDKDKNVVLEYQEKKHKYKVNKDLERKREIVDFLGCKFIEIKEY